MTVNEQPELFKGCILETNSLLQMPFTHTSSALAISAAIKSLMSDLHNFLHMSMNLRTTAVTLDSLLKKLYHVNSIALDIPLISYIDEGRLHEYFITLSKLKYNGSSSVFQSNPSTPTL